MAAADTDVADAPERRTPVGDSAIAATRSRRPLPWSLLVISAIFSMAVGLLVAWWVVDPSGDDGAISPEQFLDSSQRATVSVTGEAEVGRAAPTATFSYLDGSVGALTDYAGKTVLLNFWGSYCAPCLREMPALEAVHRSSGDDVVVVGVDVSDSVESGRKMVERTGVTYDQIRDPEAKLAAAFGGIQLPHSVVIDGKGTVVAMVDGAQTEAELRELLGAG